MFSMTDSKKENENGLALEKASSLIEEKDYRSAFACLLDLLKNDPKNSSALEAAARTAAKLGDRAGGELFESLAGNPEDPELLYRTGFHLTGNGRSDVGIPYLEACMAVCPENGDVRYELGYACFQSRLFERSADLLSDLRGLSPERIAASGLLRVESLLYSGRIDEAAADLSRLKNASLPAGAEDSLLAMNLLLRRLRRIGEEPPRSLREWHYAQHGAVLLSESRREGNMGRYPSLSMNSTAIGAVIRQLKTFLDLIEIIPSAILFHDTDGEILALAAGSILERPVRGFSQRSGKRELLVIPDTESLKGIEETVSSRADVEHLFCFRIDPARSAPVVPDITGIMARAFRFPWQSRIEVFETTGEKPLAREIAADDRPPWEIAREIADAGRQLPEDGRMIEASGFYCRHRNLLISTNSKLFPFRRAFTTFSPF